MRLKVYFRLLEQFSVFLVYPQRNASKYIVCSNVHDDERIPHLHESLNFLTISAWRQCFALFLCITRARYVF